MFHLDHILYAVLDLQKGMEAFENLTGVCPVYGGRHPGLGTHNALVSLGEKEYFELIAPDPNPKIPRDEIIFDLGKIKTPRVITWAVRPTNVHELGTKIQISEFADGKRVREDGNSPSCFQSYHSRLK